MYLRFCFGVLVLGVLVARTDAAPQTPPPATQPATQPTTTQAAEPDDAVTEAATEITTSEIETRIAQVESASDLDDAVRAELLSLYNQTLDQLQLIDTWRTKTTEYRTGREQAPAHLDQARSALAETTTRTREPPTIDIPAGATLDTLTQRLAEAESTLAAAKAEAARLDTEVENRAERMKRLPDALSDAKDRLVRTTADLDAPPPTGTPARVAEARRIFLLAQKRALEAEISAYREELAFYDARSDVLATRRDRARLLVSAAQSEVDAWRAAVSARRQAEAEQQKEAAAAELARSPESLRALSTRNQELANDLSGLEPKLASAAKATKAAETATQQLEDELKKLRAQVKRPTIAQLIGPKMREMRRRLLELRVHQQYLREARNEFTRVVTQLEEYDEERSALLKRETRVEDELARVLEANAEADPARIEGLIRERLDRQYELLARLTSDYRTYTNQLIDRIDKEQTLLSTVDQLGAFIEEHVLWLRSAPPIHRTTLPGNAVQLLDQLRHIGTGLVRDVRHNLIAYLFAAIIITGLMIFRRRQVAALHRIRDRVTKIYSDSYRLTFDALGHTILMVVPGPLAFALLGSRLPHVVPLTAPETYELAGALGIACRAAAVILFMLSFGRQAARPHGLCDTHFRWNAAGARTMRRHLLWLVLVLVPATIVVATTERYSNSDWRDSLGRVTFLVAMLALALFAQRTLHPTHGALREWLRRNPTSWTHRLRYVWYALIVAVPIAIAIAAAAGWYYTAIQISKRLTQTVWLLLGLLLLHGLLVRWVFVAQRKLAIEQARKKRAAMLEARAAEAKAGGQAEPTEPPPPLDESTFNLVTIGTQTRKLLRALFAFGLVIGLWLTWTDLLPALNFMENVHLWSYTIERTSGDAENGEVVKAIQYITLQHVALALFIGLVTYVLARNIPGLLEIAVLQYLPIDTGGRFAATAVARYIIVVLGTISVFGAVGIGWSKVQWLIAAISVGLGFGLQEIFANFVSGLMLLFERPIRIGDTVTVGNVSGTVTRIRIRATTITDWDRKELIIPNKEFITGQVINWSLSDSLLRVTVTVGIAYGSDTDKAEKLLYQVVRDEPNVLADPEPRVLFLEFGDSSLNFDVRVYIPSVDYFLQTKHRLHKAIDNAFREAGIEIAFPQRDIHVRSIRSALPIVNPPENTAQG